jgi:hypothetical protein
LTSKEKSELREKTYHKGLTYEIQTNDYTYEGMENFLKYITQTRSSILWKFLLQSLECYPKYFKQEFFRGEYKWAYRKDHIAYFESRLLKNLKNINWIFDRKDNCVQPNQISLSELPDYYTKNNENVAILIDALRFQVDEIKQIEEKTGGKFIPKDEYEEYLKWKQEQSEKETKTEKEDDGWISEVEPESIEPTVEEIDPAILDTPDYRGQRPFESNTGNKDDDSETDTRDESEKVRSRKKLKDIGKWGERFVYNHLQKQVNQDINEIIWLNENGDSGKGYDISIVSDGKEIEYIEVKSKTDSDPQLLEITGTQWEFARKLYNENEGDKYKIYVVSNAGTEGAKIGIIKNPIKLWKEGKLYAHPVNFKL